MTTLAARTIAAETAKYADAVSYEGRKVTLVYLPSMGFGITTQEVRLLTSTITTYAQYYNIVRITYIPKGARTARVMFMLPAMDAAIIEGWGHKSFDNFTAPQRSESGAVVSHGLHTACSDMWSVDMYSYLSDLRASYIMRESMLCENRF